MPPYANTDLDDAQVEDGHVVGDGRKPAMSSATTLGWAKPNDKRARCTPALCSCWLGRSPVTVRPSCRPVLPHTTCWFGRSPMARCCCWFERNPVKRARSKTGPSFTTTLRELSRSSPEYSKVLRSSRQGGHGTQQHLVGCQAACASLVVSLDKWLDGIVGCVVCCLVGGLVGCPVG